MLALPFLTCIGERLIMQSLFELRSADGSQWVRVGASWCESSVESDLHFLSRRKLCSIFCKDDFAFVYNRERSSTIGDHVC